MGGPFGPPALRYKQDSAYPSVSLLVQAVDYSLHEC